MRWRGDDYSRLVTAAKIILPLIALGILSTLFLLARPQTEGEPLRYADDEVQYLAEEQRLGAPTFKSVAENGTQILMEAASFFPDEALPEVTHGVDLMTRFITPDGLVYDVSADIGRIDEKADKTTLSDNVRIRTSSGYEIRTEKARVDTDLTYLETLEPVHGEGPLGRLDAEKMEIFSDPETGRDTRMVFTGGVHLLYTP